VFVCLFVFLTRESCVNKHVTCIKVHEFGVVVQEIDGNVLVIIYVGSAVALWLRYCATNRKVAGSIPDGVIGIFH
jgi:hypothetical protein